LTATPAPHDFSSVEIAECAVTVFALVENRFPAQSRLRTLEYQNFEKPPAGVQRHSQSLSWQAIIAGLLARLQRLFSRAGLIGGGEE